MDAGERMSGMLVRWNDERGFGFIAPDNGGPDIFVHVSALPADSPRPVVNERFHFGIETDAQGAPRAVRMRRPNEQARMRRARKRTTPSQRSDRSWPEATFALLAIAAIAWYAFDRYGDRLPIDKTVDATAAATAPAPAALYRCDGRTHCSEMRSCAEARYFLAHCPNVKMDGDGDGEPCEQQWCH